MVIDRLIGELYRFTVLSASIAHASQKVSLPLISFGIMPYPNETSGLLEPPITPKTTGNTIKANALTALFDQPVPYDPIRDELDSFDVEEDQEEESQCPKLNGQSINVKSTIIGSLVFLLYHIVFCLAQAATITRPHANHSSTGIMAKTAALGIFTAGPMCK